MAKSTHKIPIAPRDWASPKKWSDPVRHERIIARIVECLLEAKLAEAKEVWRSRVSMAKTMSQALLSVRSMADVEDRELLAFFSSLAASPVTKQSLSLWPAQQRPHGSPPHLGRTAPSVLEGAWDRAIALLTKKANGGGYRLLSVGIRDFARVAFAKLSENAGIYEHLTKLPSVAPTPRPRKPKRTLVQTRAAKAEEAAKLWRRRLRVAKAKLEKYTKQMKYYAKKEVKE